MTKVISVENLSKSYRLGQIGTGTFANDLKIWWAKMRGKPNPLLRIGEKDHGNRDGETLWALKDVSFTVEQGEALSIIGRNGAGKSTLLKILSRVTAPTSGRVRVKGRVASLLEVGTGFHPELTGRENVYLNGAILGMSRREIARKFDEIVDFSGVEKFIDTPVKRYSSGMYVRLAFAVAAHLEPEILVVDEVLAVGDAEFQNKCLGKMGDVAHEGRTVLFVSHNMVAVKKLCSQCAWIDKGSLMEIGGTEAVVDSYSRVVLTKAREGSFADASIMGDGRVDLISYQTANHQGDSHSLPITNEDMSIRIKMRVNEVIAQPACGISIVNEQGVLMTSINTVEQGMTLSNFPEGELELTVQLGQVAFLPGTYIASFWVMNPQGHIYIMATDAIRFEIGQGNIYGTRHIDHRWGCVFTDIKFSMDQSPNV
jgi:lipopolysaccharide transport system ATP-binding protein